MQIPYTIVIPSYQRPAILRDRTLAMCDRYGVPKEQIILFLATDDPRLLEYKTLFADVYRIVEGPVGLCNMRNFITDYFPERSRLLSMDDDLEGIFELNEDPSHPIESCKRYPLKELTSLKFHKWILDAWSKLGDGGGMFGIYPVKNGFFMKDLPALDEAKVRFCVGAFWGAVNSKSIRITMDEKEDFERTLKFAAGGHLVHRWNHVTLKTKFYKNQGGMQAAGQADRKAASEASCNRLANMFPGLCRIYRGKKNGMTEVRIR